MLIAVIIVGIAAVFGLIFYASGQKNKAAAGWPTVPGKVVSSEVQTLRSGGGGPNDLSFEPNVVYSYTVDGQTFSGNKVNFSAFRSTNKAAPQKTVDRYLPGTEVTVHYNPKKPQEAVLEILGQK